MGGLDRRPGGVRVWPIAYRAHDGARRAAYVLLPSWYGPRRNPSIPLVISPHGRGVDGRSNARLWGRLPAVGHFAVVNPDGEGRRLPLYSWGAAGQVSDLARMGQVVHRALPWLRITPDRIYGVGSSMGGQETLLLVARRPRLLAGAAVFDAPTDLALQYRDFPRLPCNATCLRQWRRPIGPSLQKLARVEVGGTPATAPRAYARRSPRTYVGAIAASGVPLQLWWSSADRIVGDVRRQEVAFARALRRRGLRAPLDTVVGSWTHDVGMRVNLPAALRRFGLLRPLPAFAQQRSP